MLSKLVLSGGLSPVPVDELSTGVAAPAKTFAERSSAMAATLAVAGSSGAVADSSRSASAASAKISKRRGVGAQLRTDPLQLALRGEVLRVVRPEAAAERADDRPDHEALPAPALARRPNSPQVSAGVSVPASVRRGS